MRNSDALPSESLGAKSSSRMPSQSHVRRPRDSVGQIDLCLRFSRVRRSNWHSDRNHEHTRRDARRISNLTLASAFKNPAGPNENVPGNREWISKDPWSLFAFHETAGAGGLAGEVIQPGVAGHRLPPQLLALIRD